MTKRVMLYINVSLHYLLNEMINNNSLKTKLQYITDTITRNSWAFEVVVGRESRGEGGLPACM